MNESLLWALGLAVLLVGAGGLWALARRAGRRRTPPQAGAAAPAPRPAQRAAAGPAAMPPTAQAALPLARQATHPPPLPDAADRAPVAAQRALVTEALRQARRRAAADAARLAAARLAAPPLPARPPAARPARAMPAAAPATAAPAAAPSITVLADAPQPAAVLAAAGRPSAVQPDAARPEAEPPRPAARPALAAPPTVLVVDDSKVVRIKTSRLLEKHHYRVLLADDGLAALHCLAQQPADLVITDVEMPGLDGFGLTRRLRNQPRWAGLPVIMITSSDDKHRRDAAAVGVSVLLGKPYAEAALLAEVHKALGSPARQAGAARADAAPAATALADTALALP